MTRSRSLPFLILLLAAPALAGCLDPGSPWACPTEPCKVRGVQATLGFEGTRDDMAVHEVAARLGYTENVTGGEGGDTVLSADTPGGDRLKVVFLRTLDDAEPPTATFLAVLEILDPDGVQEVAPEDMGAYLAARRQAERAETEAFWTVLEHDLGWKLGSGPAWAPLYADTPGP